MFFDTLRQQAYNSYKNWETRESRLLYLFFEITRRCNLACIHCGSDCSRESTMRELSTSTWISIMDHIGARAKPFIVLTGGEPLVRTDLLEITNALQQRLFEWGMVTNGLALKKDLFEKLYASGLASMTVSLDGPKEAHNYLRRSSQAYPAAINALKLVGGSKLKYKDAVTCVFPSNLETLDETAKILIDCGITSWRLFRIFPRGKAAQNSNLQLDTEQTKLLLEWIQQVRPFYKPQGLDISYSCEGYVPFSIDRKIRDEPYFCRSGINIAAILADGTVTGCNNNAPEYYQGNLSATGFWDIWDTKFADYRDRTWMRTGICINCKHWINCKGSSIHLKEKNKEGPGFCYLSAGER